jgi:hypothetical protein
VTEGVESAKDPAASERWLRRGEAAFVVLAAILSLGFWILLPGRLPSDDDYRTAAAYIAQGFKPGDAVLLYPAWAEHWRMFLDVSPVLAVPHPDLEDLTRTRRVWLAGLPDVPRSDYDHVAGRMALRYHALDAPRRFGHLAVNLYENPGYAEPIFDFRAEVPRAHVRLGNDPCPWDGRAHRCRAAPWVHVADELHEIEFLPRHCIWAHPAGATPLIIEYDGVPLGRRIRIRGGISTQVAWRKDPNWGPLTFAVYVGGTQAGSMTIEVADGQEQTLDVDTSGSAGSTRDVVFTVSAPRPDNRQFCFDATAW